MPRYLVHVLAVAVMLMIAIVSVARAQSESSDCASMLKEAWADTAAVRRAIQERDKSDLSSEPITVIDGALATPEQVRTLRSAGPAGLDRLVQRIEILSKEAAEQIVGSPLPARVVCIIKKPTGGTKR